MAVMGPFLDTFFSFHGFSLLIMFPSSLFSSESSSHSSSCKIRRQFYLNGMHKPGDVILGGLFEVHYTSVFPELTFTSEPTKLSCQG